MVGASARNIVDHTRTLIYSNGPEMKGKESITEEGPASEQAESVRAPSALEASPSKPKRDPEKMARVRRQLWNKAYEMVKQDAAKRREAKAAGLNPFRAVKTKRTRKFNRGDAPHRAKGPG